MRKALLTILAVFVAAPLCAAEPATGKTIVYFGTYSGGKSKGIYYAPFGASTGRVGTPELAAELTNPSYLAIHPSKKWLYAIGEISGFNKGPGGAVSAMAIEPDGRLTLLNQQSSGGPGPCHVSVDPSGRCALVANYGGGSVASLPIGPDGRLGEAVSVIQHRGKGANPRRQEGPHAHSINCDAAGRFAFAPDLGLDKVFVYRLDAAKASLSDNEPPFAKLPDGAGPRHFAFHPNGRFAFVIDELDCTVAVFAYDAQRGVLDRKQIVSTLPEGTERRDDYTCADIHVHPSGKFVYGSNRGHHSIAMFSCNPETGELKLLGCEPTRGKTPRNFALDPAGRFLLAANQDSDSVTVFRIDEATGRLAPVGRPIEVPKPVCIKFLTLGP